MKKKMLVSLLLIGLVAALVAGGTFAYFTSVVTNTGNTFTAGTLDIKTNTPTSAFFNIGGTSGMKPGDSGSATLTLTNSGTIAASNVALSTAITPTVGPNKGDLANDLYVTVSVNGTPINATPETLTQFAASAPTLAGIAAGGTETFTVAWTFKDNGTPNSNTTEDNAYQGSSDSVAFTFTANQ